MARTCFLKLFTLSALLVSCSGSMQTNIEGKWRIVKVDCTDSANIKRLCKQYYELKLLGHFIEFKGDSVKWFEKNRFHPFGLDEEDSLIVLPKENIKILKLTRSELVIKESESNGTLTTFCKRSD